MEAVGTPAQQRKVPHQPIATYGFIAAMTMLLIGFATASLSGAYGLAILACCVGCVLAILMYRRSDHSVSARGALAALLAAIMAYIPSAATLPQVVSSVVNATTLKPAIVYPFITGLKFVPLFCVVLFEWVLRAFHGNIGFRREPPQRSGYVIRAATVLLVTTIALVESSGEDRIWHDSLPGCQTIVLGYLFVVVINVAVFLVGYREFDKEEVASYRPLLMACIVAYIPLVLAGFFMDQAYNSINSQYLDKRRRDVYFAANPGAIEDFKRLPNDLASEIGPDLRSLLSDPYFEHALRTQHFYKQDFDELFQIGTRSVMFRFKAVGERISGRTEIHDNSVSRKDGSSAEISNSSRVKGPAARRDRPPVR